MIIMFLYSYSSSDRIQIVVKTTLSKEIFNDFEKVMESAHETSYVSFNKCMAIIHHRQS